MNNTQAIEDARTILQASQKGFETDYFCLAQQLISGMRIAAEIDNPTKCYLTIEASKARLYLERNQNRRNTLKIKYFPKPINTIKYV